MKRTTSILTCLMVAGLAWAQNPQIIQNTRTKMQTVENNATAASNQALGDNASSKPAAGAHNTAAKTGASPFKTGNAAPVQTKPAPAPTKSTKSTGTVAVKPAAGAKPAKVAVEPRKTAPAPKSSPPAAASSSESSAASAGEAAKNEDQDSPDKKWSMTGKRDPFVSPVVNHVGGSGCSTGKKCLEIGAINLRGVVRSEAGFIAVVTNSLNKAYFLRENDPVFDGYVVKITDDSITFKEMLQDRLGKTLTREVVKKITTPAV